MTNWLHMPRVQQNFSEFFSSFSSYEGRRYFSAAKAPPEVTCKDIATRRESGSCSRWNKWRTEDVGTWGVVLSYRRRLIWLLYFIIIIILWHLSTQVFTVSSPRIPSFLPFLWRSVGGDKEDPVPWLNQQSLFILQFHHHRIYALWLVDIQAWQWLFLGLIVTISKL